MSHQGHVYALSPSYRLEEYRIERLPGSGGG